MPIAKIGSLDFYYEVHGKGEKLLIIPGIASDVRLLQFFIDGLKHRFEILILDIKGSGLSSAPDGDYTIDQMANEIAKVLHYLNWSQMHLFGFSLGGAIAQKLLAEHPDLFLKAILATTAIQFQKPFHIALDVINELYAVRAAREVIVKQYICLGVSHFYLCKPDRYETILNSLSNHSHFQSPMGFQGQLKAIQKFNSKKWVETIKTPTLILAAENDILTPPEQSYDLHEAIKGSHIIDIPESGHLLVLEKPHIVQDYMIEFFLSDTPSFKTIAI
ncbi:MAG: alpha/beta hydrolase [Simkaniaceae bacterium]|nr:alpha/beta hydrolase [Simkaniaceae bacterium]